MFYVQSSFYMSFVCFSSQLVWMCRHSSLVFFCLSADFFFDHWYFQVFAYILVSDILWGVDYCSQYLRFQRLQFIYVTHCRCPPQWHSIRLNWFYYHFVNFQFIFQAEFTVFNQLANTYVLFLPVFCLEVIQYIASI